MIKNIIALFFFLFCFGCHCGQVCIKEHKETVYQPMWFQTVIIDKNTFIIYHPPQEYVITVCDEWVTEVEKQ